MLRVDEAYHAIVGAIAPLPAERLPLPAAHGRVLAEDVVAREAIPPFDNSAMDGYAVRVADVAGAGEHTPVVLRVAGDLPAGADARGVRVEPGTAVRIMTGAPLPEGAEAVLMREDTREGGDRVEALCPAEPGEHVRKAGEDIAPGRTVLTAGTPLKPAAIGVLASIGVADVLVVRRPRVAILATGDELVGLAEPLGPGRIRASSSYALEALVAAAGAEPVMLGIARDEREDLRRKLAEGARADLLLTTGGVSVGDHDLVREMLAAEGEVAFWRINMQPGKPLAFGRVGGTPVIGLPGNPVSTLVGFELFVRPAIRKLAGHAQLRRPPVRARLAAAHEKRGDRRQFLRAHVEWAGDAFVATLDPGQGSHQLSGMARGNALVVLPEGPGRYVEGHLVEVVLLEEIEAYAGRHPDAE
jgi:molybdopterin molybdotransferase